ncbi:MAG: alpha-1,2-fucosyltransferase [Bacteroidales bacterium]|nr:alpha-1,2-fucosyltransferase [Candidatus Cryptobacteroides onthequi]
MKVMINMACGLANRMFQYSYYLYLRSLGYDASVDFYTAAKLAHESVAWNRIFPQASFTEASRMAVMMDGGGSSFQARFRRKFLPFTCRVEQMPTSFDASVPSTGKKRTYVIGVFQNAEMVSAVKEEVLKAFRFPEIEGEANHRLMQEMAECESVAIHVRKGKDYAALDWYSHTCEMDYYRAAVDYMKSHLEHPRFYVFADNPEWVRENFKDFEYTLVEGNPTSGWGSHFDMQLMSSCRHNIISNSTYSWWGAFLNRSVDKIVVGPKYWFNPQGDYKEKTSDRVLSKEWIAL